MPRDQEQFDQKDRLNPVQRLRYQANRLRRGLETLKKIGHFGIQSSGDHLQGNYSDFPLALLYIRNVRASHVQTNRHIGLSPAFALAKVSDSLSEFNKGSMLFAGHLYIVSVISDTRV